MTSSTEAIVNIQKMSKTYPGKTPVEAVKGIDLAVERGELFGLLGPNGAGKSTTISVCTTRSLPTGGRVTIAGIDVVAHPAEARRFMGVVTQYNTLDRQCTVWENLYFHCRYFGLSHAHSAKKADELLELFKLTERKKSFVRELSGGLAQRVQIARAIAHDPEVLFLDEPSAGLDPQTRLALWDIIRVLREKGITIVLTTHYMDEAQHLADRICVIAAGKVVAQGTPETLRAGTDQLTHIRFELPSGVVPSALPLKVSVEDGIAVIETATPTRTLSDLTTWAVAQGLELPNLEVARPSLEDVYLELTKDE